MFCQTALPINDAANPQNVGLGGLPLLFPDAGILSPDTNMAHLLQLANTPVYANGRVSVLPTFAFGSRIANPPPNPPFPTGGGLNQVTSEDFSASITKLIGRHAIKAGYYQDHTAKVQTAAPGTGGGTFRGAINFANDTNNPLDSTCGFANAALGVFDTFQQINNIREGANAFHNYEGYIQDTWRLGRLTLDYGLRIIDQVPQHDEKNQTSNFLPEQWKAYERADPVRGGLRQRRQPVLGQQPPGVESPHRHLAGRRVVVAHRHHRPGNGQPPERCAPGRRGHREGRDRLAESQTRAEVWLRV